MAHHSHETPQMHDAVDEWHDHSHDEKPMEAHSEVGNPHLVIGVGLLSFGLVVVACIAIYMYYIGYVGNRLREAERAGAVAGMDTRNWKQGQLADLDAYGWFNKETVQVPLSAAAASVIAEYEAAAKAAEQSKQQQRGLPMPPPIRRPPQ
jgi:hypothetical protein